MTLNRELVGDMLDLVEDLLDEKDITVPSDDREGDEDEARLYGMEYSRLLDAFEGMLDYYYPEGGMDPGAGGETDKSILGKFKIPYGGQSYGATVEGGDEKGAGGIWDLAGAFADNICVQLDGDIHFSDDLDGARLIIQEGTYNLIKYDILGELERQLSKQSEM